MSGDPSGIGSKLTSACFGLLLAAMALYGAVQIIAAIWVPLCIVAAGVAGSVVLVGAVRYWRTNRW